MAERRKDRYFYLKDVDCVITVEYGKNKKDVLGWMDEIIENLQYSYYDPDDTVQILYEDGTEDYIDKNYDGHKIRRQHIESIVYANDETYIVFGNFAMNECGVCYPAFAECIDNTNIIEVNDPHYRA